MNVVPDLRPTWSSSSVGTGLRKPAPIRHFEPIRPLVSLKTRTWARAMYLMTFTVTGESRPSGFSSGSPNRIRSPTIPRFQTISSCSLRLRQPSGVRIIVWW